MSKQMGRRKKEHRAFIEYLKKYFISNHTVWVGNMDRLYFIEQETGFMNHTIWKRINRSIKAFKHKLNNAEEIILVENGIETILYSKEELLEHFLILHLANVK